VIALLVLLPTSDPGVYFCRAALFGLLAEVRELVYQVVLAHWCHDGERPLLCEIRDPDQAELAMRAEPFEGRLDGKPASLRVRWSQRPITPRLALVDEARALRVVRPGDWVAAVREGLAEEDAVPQAPGAREAPGGYRPLGQLRVAV
jgi:hypothetical protein